MSSSSSSSSSTVESASNLSIAVSIVRRQNQNHVGAAVHKRLNRGSMDDKKTSSITLFEFMDNEQFSSLDSFLIQMGGCILYLSEEYENSQKGDGRKISNLLHGKDIECVFVKKSLFTTKDVGTNILKLVGTATHITNVAETEKPVAYSCIEVLLRSLRLLKADGGEDVTGSHVLLFGALESAMRLDSAAADAVNLLPKPDHPSQFGSLYGVLNRCKTKMGSRLLERWLRQPLVSVDAINERLDIVEILKDATVYRNQLVDGPLRQAPDLDTIIAKMQRKNAGLDEVYRLYAFTRSLPTLVRILKDVADRTNQKNSDDGEDVGNDDDMQVSSTPSDDVKNTARAIQSKFIEPLEKLVEKFSLYQQLVEHVIDMDQLPELVVRPHHDETLLELHEEQEELERQAEKLLQAARNSWGSFTDIKLEKSPVWGLIFRTPRADDERSLRANKSDVRILQIQKNGPHFTTSQLEPLGDRSKAIDKEYKELQKELVGKAVETAVSYLPLAEAAAALVSEVDVLTSFAAAAALAPGEYARPQIHPCGAGIMKLDKARHPCVELMDGVEFIPNSYEFVRDQSLFQIVTGPNMGGKSTYIRGIGSIVVMAQCGSFVPCESAEISIVDAILARVGAGDAVQKGVSTFMAEMLEASVILQTATRNSLIIIDELGRGTSTFDGFGLAWAISEYIVTHTDCICLFATHFHELTALSSKHACVVNKHVSACIDRGNVCMLYAVNDGPCTQSYGVHVAATANFPMEVINEAKRKAKELEGSVNDDVDSSSSACGSQSFKRVKESVTAFGAMKDISTIPGAKLKPDLQALFPKHATVA